MLHPEMMRFLAADRLETLRRDAVRPRPNARSRATSDTGDVELRLCRVADDPELDLLAELEGKPAPAGRHVVAVVRDRVVAAVSLVDGSTLADPFVRTDHLLPLLQLRAAQLREPAPRRFGLLHYASLIRGSIQA
jgi:hypothetical protein